jgi:anti-sigma factor RsiW
MTEWNDSRLWRYLDGELPPAEAEALERAAAADATLGSRLDELRLLGEAVRDGVPTAPAGFPARVAAMAQLRGAGPREAEILDLRRFARRVLVAAALLAAVGLGYLAFEVVPDLMPDRLSASPDPTLERPR